MAELAYYDFDAKQLKKRAGLPKPVLLQLELLDLVTLNTKNLVEALGVLEAVKLHIWREEYPSPPAKGEK
jgi:hypothetical protein